MKSVWNSLLLHRDLVVAVGLAFIFGLIFSPVGALFLEMLPANSPIRMALRRIQNKLAAQSVAKLRKRIASLEKYRENLVTDKAHYLSTLRFILVMLMLTALGLVVFVLGRIELFGRPVFPPPGSFDLLALMCWGLATFLGVFALKIAALDTEDKINTKLAGIDADIQELSSKLPPG